MRVNTCDLGRIIRNHRMTRTENPPRERGIMSTVWHTFPAWQGKHPSGCASPRTHESAEALSEKQAKPCRPGSIEPLKEHGRNLLPPPSPHDRPEHAENTNGSRLATAAGMTVDRLCPHCGRACGTSSLRGRASFGVQPKGKLVNARWHGDASGRETNLWQSKHLEQCASS